MNLKIVLLISLMASAVLFGLPQQSNALDCSGELWIYDDFESQELYDESDLFADTSFIKWGTPVCQIAKKARFLTTWIQVRIEDGRTGWLKENSLYSDEDYLARVESRIEENVKKIADLQKTLEQLKSEQAKYDSDSVFLAEEDQGSSTETTAEEVGACGLWVQEIRYQDTSSFPDLELFYCQ